MTRAIDYATPARSESSSHAHVCPACRQPWSCPDPECARPAELICPVCAGRLLTSATLALIHEAEARRERGDNSVVALSLARSGWAALREEQP